MLCNTKYIVDIEVQLNNTRVVTFPRQHWLRERALHIHLPYFLLLLLFHLRLSNIFILFFKFLIYQPSADFSD